jgi:glucose-1-phosphate adenylyltransferase
MDLLDPKSIIDVKDIYSKNPMMPPHYVSDEANVQNSLIADGCMVEGEVFNSILFAGVKVEKGAKIDYSIVMPNTVIKAGADVKYSIISENTVIGQNAKVGGNPLDYDDKDEWGISVVGDELIIGDDVVIPPKAMIGENMEVKK